MIRTILAAILIIFFFIVTIPVLFILWIIGLINMKVHDVISYGIMKIAFSIILFVCGAKVSVEGIDNIPKDKPVLYVGNHRSYFDILLTYTRCPRLTGYIAKAEMEKIPLLSNWMHYLHCLFLDRKDIKKGLKTILSGIELIKSGISVCIFPEGTRNRNESDLELLEFHEGSFRLATKTDCLIVPIAMNNTVSIFEKQFPKIRKNHVVLEYCKPFRPSELSKEEQKHIGEYTRTLILESLKKNEPLV